MTGDAHVSVDLIADLVSDLLTADEAIAVNAHLAGCTECADLRDALLDVTATLQDEAADPIPMPADVSARLDAAIAEAAQERAQPPVRQLSDGSRRALRWLGGAAAAVVVVGLGVAGVRSIPQQSSDSNSSAPAADQQSSMDSSGSALGGAVPTPGKDGGTFVGGGSAKTPDYGAEYAQAELRRVIDKARLISDNPAAAVSPSVAGCAEPPTDAIHSVVRFDGSLRVLNVDTASQTATVLDCVTANHVLFQATY